jgi:hypothetical protein
MSIQKIIVSGRANVASWLSANATEYFASYTMDGNTMIAKDAQNNVMLEWDGSNVKIYKSATVFDTKAADTASAGTYTISKCNGGIMVIAGSESSNEMSLILTKTNNDVTAVIVGSGSSNRANALTNSICAAAWGDAEDATKTRWFYTSAENQTQFVSFTTYAKPDTISYTPNAFYMPVGEYYDWSYGKFTAGGDTYITNGYWAIKDAG